MCLLTACVRQPLPEPDTLLAEVPAAQTRVAVAAFNPAAQGLASWKALAPGLADNLVYVSSKNPEEVAVADGDVTVTWHEVRQSLELLQSLLPKLDNEPQLLAERFRWLRLRGAAHFSGYYEAEVLASRTQKPGFRHPLYAAPKDLKTLRLSDFRRDLIGMRLGYRMDSGGEAVPYYTREDIDTDGALRNRGLELAWVADPMDAFFLQVQGSGRLRFNDGSQTSILYAADNGRPYTGMGQTLAGMGQIDPAAISMESVRSWMRNNPDKSEAMRNRNARYVFFKLADSGPVGSMGRELTPRVSLAVDRTTFPLGSVVLFSTPFPKEGNTKNVHSGKLTGIGLAQDTGEAIKLRRLDIFCGHGEQAEFQAGHLNAEGEAWLLLAK